MFPTEETQISSIISDEEFEQAATPVVITQEDIDNTIIAWNSDTDSKISVYEYFVQSDNARSLDAAEFLMTEFVGEPEGLTVIKDGVDSVAVPWDKVQQRIGIMLDERQFLTPQEWDIVREKERIEAAALVSPQAETIVPGGIPITRNLAEAFRDPHDHRNDFIYARDDDGQLFISNRYIIIKTEEQDIDKVTEQLNHYRNADRRRTQLPPLTAVENNVLLEHLNNVGDTHKLDTSRSFSFKPYQDSAHENIIYTDGAQYFMYNRHFVEAFGSDTSVNVENATDFDCRKQNLFITDNNGAALGLILPMKTTDRLYENLKDTFPLDMPYKTRLERIKENPTNDTYIGREFYDGRNNYIVASLESVRPLGPAGGDSADNQPEPHYLICEINQDPANPDQPPTVAEHGSYIKAADMDDRISLWESNREAAEAVKAQAELRAQAEAEARAVYENTHGFADNLPPMQKARVLETLDKGFITKEYGNLSTKAFMETAIQDGCRVEAVDMLRKKYQNNDYGIHDYLNEYVHNGHERSQTWTAFASVQRDDPNSQHAEFLKDKHPFLYYLTFNDKSVLPDSFFSTEYRLVTGQTENGGDIFYSINKTTHDYGKYLIDNGIFAEEQITTALSAETKITAEQSAETADVGTPVIDPPQGSPMWQEYQAFAIEHRDKIAFIQAGDFY
jgi:hypothetical protein